MSHLTGEYGPLRDKRRQSDAKWRASVATCYDVLKYAVPNVKHMSKKKISKALILQECEKHIQDLEDTISYLFHVECKNQGHVALWKEGDHWSQCSMAKLHEDFAEKQRRVFLASAHGRRCYNLLQDIKEDVFDMTADSRQMVFVREDGHGLLNSTDNMNDSTAAMHTASLPPFHIDSKTEIDVLECSPTIDAQIKNTTETNPVTSLQGDYQLVPSISFSDTQVRQQPRPRQRLFSDGESDADTVPLQELHGCGRNTETTPSCEPVYMLSGDSDSRNDEQVVAHCVIPTSASSIQGTSSPSSSASHNERFIPGNADDIKQSDDVLDNTSGRYRLKLEKLSDSLYVLSKEKNYPFLLGALKAEKEQEVPSMETLKIKRPRLSSCRPDIDIVTSCNNGDNSQESCCTSEHNSCTDNFLVSCDVCSKSCSSSSVGNKIAASATSGSSFSKHVYASKLGTVVETEHSSPCIMYDPLLSTLNMPKSDGDMPFVWTHSDGVVKRPSRHGSARKLNFNSPPNSGWFHTSPRSVSSDRTVVTSPMVTGFTPIKLPDDLTRNSEIPSEYLFSPWKTVNSPLNCRSVPQGYMDSISLADLEDNLFCMENLDTLDFETGLGSEITPAHTQNLVKPQQPEEMLKVKVSVLPSVPSEHEHDNRRKPTCRRRLEGFYDPSSAAVTDYASLSRRSYDMSQTLWTSQLHSHLENGSTIDVEDNLICLETMEALEPDVY